jgi:hypothetical protein
MIHPHLPEFPFGSTRNIVSLLYSGTLSRGLYLCILAFTISRSRYEQQRKSLTGDTGGGPGCTSIFAAPGKVE